MIETGMGSVTNEHGRQGAMTCGQESKPEDIWKTSHRLYQVSGMDDSCMALEV